ncbi:MAG: hypothetical protein ACK56F_21265, partial [bacterium]
MSQPWRSTWLTQRFVDVAGRPRRVHSKKEEHNCGVCRHTQQEEETAITGGVTSSAKVPKEDQDGVDMMPLGDTPAEGRYLGSAAGLNPPDRAGEAQVAQEGAPH